MSHLHLFVADFGKHDIDIKQPEFLPGAIGSNLMMWAKAFIFPSRHPYFAVSAADGRFRIDNLPLGEWEFQVWHERKGYVQTDDWMRGRFTLKIKPGEIDLGTIKLKPERFLFNHELAQRAREKADRSC